MTFLIARMQKCCELLRPHPNLNRILLSAQKPAPLDPRKIGFQTQGVSYVHGLWTLSEKYKEVLRPLQSLPAKIAIVYGGEELCLDGLKALSTQGYRALCQYMLISRINKMFASRGVPTSSSVPQAPETAIGTTVEEGNSSAEPKKELKKERLSPTVGR